MVMSGVLLRRKRLRRNLQWWKDHRSLLLRPNLRINFPKRQLRQQGRENFSGNGLLLSILVRRSRFRQGS
jgi:hypothetical protein